MYEITPEVFEAAKQSVTHGKINYLNVAGIISRSPRSVMSATVCP